MKEKEYFLILEFINQFQGIHFGYEINVFSDNKNMVALCTSKNVVVGLSQSEISKL